MNYQSPGAKVPDRWTSSIQPHLDNDGACLTEWWKGFKDPVLNELIARARAENPDFKIAMQQILKARAQRGVAKSQMLPILSSNAGYARTRQSERLGFAAPLNPIDVYSTGLESGWEIDVFGGLKRGVESADANIEASVENYRDLLVSLFADVALNYVDYCTFDERIYVANQNIGIQKKSLDLAQSRLDAGLVSKIDVAQARTNLDTSRALIPQLQGQLAAAQNRLASLTGGYPHSVTGLLSRARSIPQPRRDFAVGCPADLLRARPDIRKAERELAASVANIGVAESELYPKFSLAGSLQLQSLDISNLPDAAASAYSFGPSVRWNLFSSGQIKNLIRVEEANAMQAYAAYEKAVLLAVEEVETSLVGVATERQRLAALRRAVVSATESVDLVGDNYKEGLVDFQRVIDTERVKFQNEDQAVLSKGQVARNYIALYRALGGGAAVEEVTLPEVKRKPGGGWIKKRPAPYAAVKDLAETESNLKN
ncbi:efflux transporter outer membrane subunit [Verrucomicrobiales bacterium]|nr:efflux transporter outer membrane subunit [Verrucomicrobiales bacterium]